jgi:hypothetical protein
MAFGILAWPTGFWGLSATNEIGSNVKVFGDLARLGTEWADFVNRRLKENINLLPRLAACRCAEEVSNVYAGHFHHGVRRGGSDTALSIKARQPAPF